MDMGEDSSDEEKGGIGNVPSEGAAAGMPRTFGFVKSSQKLLDENGVAAEVGEYIPDEAEEKEHEEINKRVRPDRDFGAFEKHTKGFGSKMLQKFGFKGRIGKNETGITVPIMVKVRPQGQGLAFGGFQERIEHPDLSPGHNISLEKKPASKDLQEMDENDPDLPPLMRKLIRDQKRAQQPSRWRKTEAGAPPPPKPVFRTAADLIKESGGVRKQTIIDMRGPEVCEPPGWSSLPPFFLHRFRCVSSARWKTSGATKISMRTLFCL